MRLRAVGILCLYFIGYYLLYELSLAIATIMGIKSTEISFISMAVLNYDSATNTN